MGQPSEFGGYPGMIQPEPHQLTAAEKARVERAVDPGNDEDSEELARERGGAQTGGRGAKDIGQTQVPGGMAG